MAKTISDWFKVATAGRTADGRVIKDQWLLDIAETYDAAKQYCAMIWPEHYRWANAGLVADVKAEKDDMGRLSLYCKLEPNQLLLDYNASGQKLFTSIEVLENFAKTGKAYLGGLGITDQPGSLGTDRLSFSRKETEHGDAHFSDFIEATAITFAADEPSFLQRMVNKLSFKTETTASDDDMKPEQFEALQKSIDAQTASNLALAEKFTDLEAKISPAPAATAGDEDKGGESSTADDSGADKFTAELEKLRTANTELLAKVTEVEKQFSDLREKPAGGTTVPGNTGEGKKFL